MLRTTNGYSKMTLGMFMDTLNTISGKMTNNQNFLPLQGAVTALNTAKNEYLVQAQYASNGSKQAILARDAKRAEITTQLHNLGFSVTAVAAGNAVIMESSGFDFTKKPQTSPPLVKPVSPVLSNGENSGEILVTAKKQQGNEKVNYFITAIPEEPGSWKMTSSSRSKNLFTGLVPATRYHIKYALVGVRNQEVMSDVMTFIAQ